MKWVPTATQTHMFIGSYRHTLSTPQAHAYRIQHIRTINKIKWNKLNLYMNIEYFCWTCHSVLNFILFYPHIPSPPLALSTHGHWTYNTVPKTRNKNERNPTHKRNVRLSAQWTPTTIPSSEVWSVYSQTEAKYGWNEIYYACTCRSLYAKRVCNGKCFRR